VRRASLRDTLELHPQIRNSGSRARERRSPLRGVGEMVAGAALRPLAAGVALGRRTERELRGAVLSGADAAALAALDALLASRLAAEIVDRTLASPLARRAVGRALAGPLVEAAARDVADLAVLERVADELLPGETVDELLERAQAADMPRRVVERLLQSDELWLMVDEIARSPAVAEAIQRQSVGFADEVAGGVRSRSRRIDDRLESGARRVFGRRPRTPRDGAGSSE
jgi:hypothetical protein